MKHHIGKPNSKSQQGTVLVIALILLSVMTLLGVTGMKSSIVEEKMSGNLRDREYSSQAAESALREAETTITGWTTATAFPALDGNNGMLGEENDEPDFTNETIWASSAVGTATTLGDGQLAADPKFVLKYVGTDDFCAPAEAGGLEELGGGGFACPPTFIFRLTALGTGLTPNTQTILQEYFARQGL